MIHTKSATKHPSLKSLSLQKTCFFSKQEGIQYLQTSESVNLKFFSEKMACAASQAMLSANTCSLVSPRSFFNKCLNAKKQSPNNSFFTIRASSADDADCNIEECAPDKEPAVYVAESAISSGNAGSSSSGAENTAAVAAGLDLISIAAASSILLQVGKNPPPPVQTIDYSGLSLSYYINKFKPPEIIQASVSSQTESSPAVQPESSAPEVSQVEIESGNQQDPSASSEISAS